MAWLDDNPPKRSQFRKGRRAKIRPVIVVHTAEGNGAANVANFIKNRTTAGSYHRLVDDRQIIPLVDLNNEAYQDGTGSNPWAYGLSSAVFAADWRKMPAAKRTAIIRNKAKAAAEINAHAIASGAGPILPRRITKKQSDAGESGFIPHGDRDPGRRSDPGEHFPWDEFFTEYRQATNDTQENEMTPEQEARILAAIGEAKAEAAAAGLRAQALEEKVDRLEHATGSKHPDMVGEGTALPRMLTWMENNDSGNRPGAA